MRATIHSVAAGATLLLLFTGCCSNCQKRTQASLGQNQSLVARSQSPSDTTATASSTSSSTTTKTAEEWCEEDCFDEHGRCRFCWGHGCCHCRPYCIPTNLRYPPEGELPGIVQYPYYTCKGPDCFFAEPNPVRKQ
jgi:hypothetical protein